MGCTDSKDAPILADGPPEPPQLPNYSCSQVLGKGAFGVVFSAWSKQGNSECAVKKIDLCVTPAESVESEARLMLLSAENPRVARLREAIYDGIGHAFLVMDIYKGGDLYNGMKLHWQAKGSIPVPAVQNLAHMMAQAVDWLHQHSIVHRDVKGQNFLLDRCDIEHPACQIFLSDFGVACQLWPYHRLEQRVGTLEFWSPEVYRRSYTGKADVWALGVTTFQLLCARCPFEDEGQTMALRLQFPAEAAERSPECVSFIHGMLERKEAERLTARMAMEHDFLSTAPQACGAACHDLADLPSQSWNWESADPASISTTCSTPRASLLE